MEQTADPFDQRLAARLSSLRLERGWTLEVLAERSGISRATLSRLERGETSPTAALLGRLCTAYERPMSRLLAEVEADPQQFIPRESQPTWTDPETGFRRRGVSPPAGGYMTEMVEGALPAGAVIAYQAPSVAGLEHHLWMLAGRLELTLDGTHHALSAGDTLRYRLTGGSRFHCPGPEAAHYVIAITRP
ncbi:XRE family transcriptional regulator [Nitrospirillum sp. BR 11164]|uniref:helix-turn-helix domain-containing protein n=1 Tax=Nitrospirillum sp. BR 11164 TaxID=3104324 RepID=UPI002AFE32F9|nr:XRE family transcriptional regulator [Nitrospirillum sp. BR 11164]MEA1650371.1 XRE family transcriptional regulator [Nitrospirillum sp. BR 11164]